MNSRTVSLGHLAEIRISNVDKKETADEARVRLVNYTDVYYRDRIVPELELMTATASSGQIKAFKLKPSDVLITKDSESANDIGVAALVERTSPDMVCGYHLAILRPKLERIAGRFLYWTMNSDDIRGQLESAATGITRFGLRTDVINRVKLRLPSYSMQCAIANYLDIETARIDALVSKKRRLIELLQERRRAEVTETVFGNLSLQWVAIRRIVNLLPGFAFSSSDYVDDGIRLLRGINIAPGRLRWDSDVVYLAAEDQLHTSEYELAEGDVVLGMDRPVVGSGLRIALVSTSDLPCQLVQRVARIRGTKHADTRYIRFAIDSDSFIAYFSPIVTGVSVPHISADQILSFRVPLPSYDVQRTLAAQLTQKRMMLTATCDRLSAQIDLLTERRQALITAVVTGEIPVRTVAAPAQSSKIRKRPD